MDKRGYIYLGISVFAFSTLEIVSKIISKDFHPLQLVFLRFFFCSLVLLPFALKEIGERNIKFSKKDAMTITCLGILIVTISTTFFQLAIIYTKASIAAVIVSANPIFVAPLAYFILKEDADKSVVISLILGIIGVGIIASPYFTIDTKSLVGILCSIGNTIGFATYNVFTKKMLPRFGGLVMNCLAFSAGSLSLVIILIFARLPIFSGLDGSNILYVLYLAVVCSAAAYIFLFKGLAILPANRGSLVFFMKPFIASMLAYFILGESIAASLMIGTVFILAGLFFTVSSSNKPNNKKLVA